MASLRSRSCIIDGEAVACDEKTAIACFEVFQHACKMGLEGIVSKRKDSPYRS